MTDTAAPSAVPAVTTADAAFRRNVGLLALAQACFFSIQTLGIATTPLAAWLLLPADAKGLATVPVLMVQLGVMATTIPASLLMARIGRRGGFSIGALSGILAGAVGTLAMYRASFLLLCVAALFQGIAAAFAWYFRFAAADAAPPALKPQAISLVMAGGVLAGFLGPEAAKRAVDLLAPITFAGCYVVMSAFALAVLAIVQGIRIPPLTAAERAEPGRPMREIVRQPAYVVALLSSMLGYGVMTLVMSATPLAMQACGFKFVDSATVIQLHVIAMFLPSFFTGRLIQRFGVLPIIATGALIELGCALVNLSGIAFWNFALANVLVGLGWNFTYVGGSSLLTTTYHACERAKVQASHDFSVYTVTATAAGLSGVLQANAGWTLVNLAALPLMAVVLTASLWLRARRAGGAQG